jgi:hypothetical protein
VVINVSVIKNKIARVIAAAGGVGWLVLYLGVIYFELHLFDDKKIRRHKAEKKSFRSFFF